MSTPERLVLVDGSSYLYRAFHAMPNLTTSAGEPTGAVYGIINMLRRVLADHPARFAAVVFDARGKTFRDDLYDQYKANRAAMPDGLRSQLEPIHQVIAALGLPLLEVPGVEADDVIGTLAVAARAQGIATIMVSGDKDLAQLVGGGVTLLDTMQGVAYDAAGVKAKYGVPPTRIIDYLALIGDTADNVPGVPKVGPKTAAKWLAQYGSLDDIMAQASQIGGKIGENLRASLAQLPLSRELVTIRCDVGLDVTPAGLVPAAADDDALRQLYSRLEFKTWLAELGGLAEARDGRAAGDATYECIVDVHALERWIERLRKAPAFAFDTETTSLDALQARLVGLSFSDAPGRAAYVPVGHCYDGVPDQLALDNVLARLKPLLEDSQRLKIGQNLKYDRAVLANYEVNLAGIAFDTMLESYVLDSTATRHDMDSLALKYLGYKTIHYKDVAGSGKSQLNFAQVPIGQAIDYAAEDAEVTLRLHQVLWPRLEAAPRLKTLFETIEMPLVPVLGRMERHGVRIDVDMLARQSGELAVRIDEVERHAHEVAGVVFNIASPKQIQGILFDRLQLPVRAKTPKGQPSTAEGVLQELALDYELPGLILEHRALSKLKSTYTDKLPQMVNPQTGRLHTSYHQAVTATGRLSSADPNLQNIPIRSREGRRIREAFVAEAGYVLVAADYSQIELRIMAHLSGDVGLAAAFRRGEDVHRATAAEVFDVAPDAVSADQRRHAKAINFGLIYGMSAFGLARQLRIERGAAQEYVERYFARYPGVKAYMDRTRELARCQKYVETVFGRRLYLPEIDASNHARRQYAERTAINAPMQGTAADLIKLAMIAVDRWIQDERVDIRMIMQVHDELVLEVPQAHQVEAERTLPALMTGVADLAVPLVADVGSGYNWSACRG